MLIHRPVSKASKQHSLRPAVVEECELLVSELEARSRMIHSYQHLDLNSEHRFGVHDTEYK